MALVLANQDKTQARRLQRLAAAGQLRRVYAGVYTDDLVQPLESIVRRELFALCSLVAPESIIMTTTAMWWIRVPSLCLRFPTDSPPEHQPR